MPKKKPSARLRELREDLEFTAAEFGRAVGVMGYKTIARWENEEREMPGPMIFLLDLLDAVPPARKWLVQKVKDARK